MAGLADRLREARERAGLSARGLDDKAGITPGHTSAIESGGRKRPAAETLHKIAMALGVSIDSLMSDADATGPGLAVTDATGPGLAMTDEKAAEVLAPLDSDSEVTLRIRRTAGG